jgi:predicted nucleic acid-binding protein
MTNSQVCVDASLIVWSLVPYPLSSAAEALLDNWQKTDTQLIAPALLGFEITSTLRRLVYMREISLVVGEEAFARFLRIQIQLESHPGIFPHAWRIANELNLARAYDASYLAVAQANQCDFWTADQKLYNAVHAKLPWVRWLGNFGQPSS